MVSELGSSRKAGHEELGNKGLVAEDEGEFEQSKFRSSLAQMICGSILKKGLMTPKRRNHLHTILNITHGNIMVF